MSRIYIALDLETTGLHAERDAIIEIGAVKFRVGTESENTTLASWSTFVNPGRSIPYRTSRLTGITQREVERAPHLRVALEQLAAFVGNYPIVGHNIAFDLGFLQRHNCLVGNASLDTFELASILLPQAPRYSLAQLADHLGLDLESHHRALEDAIATQQLFTRLWQIACQLPHDVIAVINTVASNSPWSLRSFFAAVARQQTTSGKALPASLAPSLPLVPPPLTGRSAPSPVLNADALAALFSRDAAIGRTLPRFEERPQQVQMLRGIVQAFNRGEHLLVEAGTGTGKSLAYLLPAIFQAVASNSPVVISTNTINLQDQLFNQDLPTLATALEPLGVHFQAAILKGRTNYVCPHRLELFMRRLQFNAIEARALARLLVWLPVTQTGDRSEVALQSDEEALWLEVCADPESCRPDACTARNACFFQRARAAALGSHVLIVNHALLLTDLAVETGQPILPTYEYVVIDEAHHLEARASEQFGARLSRQQLEQLCLRLHDPRERRPTGLLPTIAARCEPLRSGAAAEVQRQCGLLGREVEQITRDIAPLFDTVREALAPWAGRGGGDYDHNIRLKREIRLSGGWRRVIEATALLDRFDRLADRLVALHAQLRTGDLGLGEEVVEPLGRLGRDLRSIQQELRRIIVEPEANDIGWVSLSPKRDDVLFHRAPLHVASHLASGLFRSKRSVILTSATLQSEGSFDYIRERLGLEPRGGSQPRRYRELSLGSPFDYRQSALVYVPTDVPEPNSPNYAQTLHRALIDLGRATRGRMLVLLTSKSQLRGVYRAISDPLANDDIVVLGQYMDGGRRQLLERFKTAQRCVLLGTQSFWEGVDVAGPALSCLVIARLPFPVPTDPVFSARAETYEDHFLQYAVPQTVIRFRQGFGRLIRSAEDRGVVALLDSRVFTKSYGSIFLNSLPAADIRFGPFRDLPPLAERWLANQPPYQKPSDMASATAD
ncbi:MAG TPA: hypothetical protein DEP84_15705 [Chloroflexi bacterium]|nr:hypothetical protein [Chloroflexota bacterium]